MTGAGVYRLGATDSAGGSSGGAVGNDNEGTANVFGTSPSFPSPTRTRKFRGPALLVLELIPVVAVVVVSKCWWWSTAVATKCAGLGGIGAAIPWVPPS